MADVARRARVSVQTVSNVMNTPELVQESTRVRVLAAIDQLGYRPNRAARSLRTSTSRLVAYRVESGPMDAIGPLLDDFLHALTDAASSHGYGLLLITAGSYDEELTIYDELWCAGAVDAFVLTGIDHVDARVVELSRLGRPFVAFGRTDTVEGYSWVDVDGHGAISAVVDHLVEQGHRRVAYLGWAEGSAAAGDARLQGWREGCARHGLDESDTRRASSPNSFRAAKDAALGLLARSRRPSAVVCGSDTFAFGTYAALRELGLTPGADVAVVGFDDTTAAQVVDPPLSSVRQPIRQIGGAVIDRLQRVLTGEPPAPGQLFTPTIIVRASSARPFQPRGRP